MPRSLRQEMFDARRAREAYRQLLGAETDEATRAGYADSQVAPWGQTRRV
jgi:hypothetical protein